MGAPRAPLVVKDGVGKAADQPAHGSPEGGVTALATSPIPTARPPMISLGSSLHSRRTVREVLVGDLGLPPPLGSMSPLLASPLTPTGNAFGPDGFWASSGMRTEPRLDQLVRYEETLERGKAKQPLEVTQEKAPVPSLKRVDTGASVSTTAGSQSSYEAGRRRATTESSRRGDSLDAGQDLELQPISTTTDRKSTRLNSSHWE